MPTTLVKISGEFCNAQSDVLKRLFSNEFLSKLRQHTRCAFVIGGGNRVRGRDMANPNLRADYDHMGILASIMNGIEVRAALRNCGVQALAMAPFALAGIMDGFDKLKARAALDEDKVLLLCGGLGVPYLSTDTTAVIRGLEIQACRLVKLTTVDAIYSADPKQYAREHHTAPASEPQRFDRISYTQVLEKRLFFMDTAAIVLAQEHALPIHLCSGHDPDNLLRIVKHEPVGTLIESP